MPIPPPYGYSLDFDKVRAIELAALIDTAYQQLTDFQNHKLWTVPGPYTVTPRTYQVARRCHGRASTILSGRNLPDQKLG